MTKLCLEGTKRYYFNVYSKFPGGACPRTPSWAWLRHAGTPPQDQPLDTALRSAV